MKTLNAGVGLGESVQKWANELVAQHPHRTVIVNTHSYMYSDSTRQGERIAGVRRYMASMECRPGKS